MTGVEVVVVTEASPVWALWARPGDRAAAIAHLAGYANRHNLTLDPATITVRHHHTRRRITAAATALPSST